LCTPGKSDVPFLLIKGTNKTQNCDCGVMPISIIFQLYCGGQKMKV
jgi:hypothetical protein